MTRRPRGYFGVAVYHPKTPINIGTLWRSASIFGASFCMTIGRRYERQASDTMRTDRHTPIFHCADVEDFWAHVPRNAVPVAVEIHERSKSLVGWTHPESAVYILGPEDGSLPDAICDRAVSVIQIPGSFCLNLAVAGSIVLYDRIAKGIARAKS